MNAIKYKPIGQWITNLIVPMEFKKIRIHIEDWVIDEDLILNPNIEILLENQFLIKSQSIIKSIQDNELRVIKTSSIPLVNLSYPGNFISRHFETVLNFEVLKKMDKKIIYSFRVFY